MRTYGQCRKSTKCEHVCSRVNDFPVAGRLLHCGLRFVVGACMANMIVELWLEIRGHRTPAPPLRGSPPTWSESEDDELREVPAEFLDWEEDVPALDDLDDIAGVCVEISYCDAKGRVAARRITCRNLVSAKGLTYLDAHCHERNAPRRFRCDRIQEVIDIETGECFACDEFISEFRVEQSASAGLTWGLPRKDYARFVNALRVLVFMSRCDSEWHPLEIEEIEGFIASYWMRTEREGEPPMAGMLRRIRRMSPMPEEFFMALMAVAEDRRLAQMVRNALRSVIAADGRIAEEELYWGAKVDTYLAG